MRRLMIEQHPRYPACLFVQLQEAGTERDWKLVDYRFLPQDELPKVVGPEILTLLRRSLG